VRSFPDGTDGSAVNAADIEPIHPVSSKIAAGQTVLHFLYKEKRPKSAGSRELTAFGREI
jgi:hypothetical protein